MLPVLASAAPPSPLLSPYTFVDAEGVDLASFPVLPAPSVLEPLLQDSYERYCHGIFFGTLVQGAVWEIAVDKPPRRIGVLDAAAPVSFTARQCACRVDR